LPAPSPDDFGAALVSPVLVSFDDAAGALASPDPAEPPRFAPPALLDEDERESVL
jgi:hypothetical protein